MAKNTASSAFRKIDVDEYNEDNFRDNDEDLGSGTGSGASASDVMSLLNAGKNVDALKKVLSGAPMGNKNQQEKDTALQLVLRVLLSIKNAKSIESCVSQLDSDQRDILMKYIYRGFEIPSENSSAHLLLWHEKVFEEAGVGSIVRVLTDRKKV